MEFAQEVSQYKASEDALKGIANMSGGGGGEDGLITSRVGGTSKGGVATTTGQSSNNVRRELPTELHMYMYISYYIDNG